MRRWNKEEKLAILREAEQEGVLPTCRKYGIYPSTFYYWRRGYEKRGPDGLAPQYGKDWRRQAAELKRENERLKKLLAEKELALQLKDEMLKKSLKGWRRQE